MKPSLFSSWSETLIDKLEKRGYNKAIEDVEKIIEIKFKGEFSFVNSTPVYKYKEELKQEIARLRKDIGISTDIKLKEKS